MRIAVYTSTDQLQSVDDLNSWLLTTVNADLRLILNGGYANTERHIENNTKLVEAGVLVVNGAIRPWRNDDALNTILTLVPHHYDVCIRVDLDERLRDGWRSAIERTWQPDTTMLSHVYHWTPELSLHGERVHQRHGYRWKGSINERLIWYGDGSPNVQFAIGFVLDRDAQELFVQEADIALLARDAADWPNDPDVALTHARELVALGMLLAAKDELQRYITIAGEKGVRSAYAFRLLSQADPANAQDYFLKAETAHSCASNHLVMAEYYWKMKLYRLCYTSAQFGIMLERSKPLQYTADWTDDLRLHGPLLHELASTSAFVMLDFEAAYGHAVEAVRRAPDDERLKTHLATVERKIQSGATLEPDMRPKPAPIISVEHRRSGVR